VHPKPVEVLLVEDNPGDILLIRQILAHEPFPINVHVAVDGEQAIQMLAQQYVKPDLVILDLKLPKVSGFSFLQRCQLDVPVVVFSSSFSTDDVFRSFRLGAKEFFQKPTDLDAFAWQVSQIVRNSVCPKGRVLSAS
jgi:DNA-binding response OmpR family regulator